MKPVLLALLLLGSASATTVRLYPAFGEVREPVQLTATSYSLALPESAWAQLLPGTIDLEGAEVQSRVQRLHPSWLAAQEGQAATLIENGQREPVTLVRAEDLLIRDAQGRYRNVTFQQLAFSERPPLNAAARSQQLTLKVAAPGKATLSYLTRGLSWAPRYTLRLTGTVASLSALADMRNTTDQPYEVTAGELLAGDVSLAESPPMPYAKETADLTAATAGRAANVVPAGESRGLYRYTLSQPFTLEGGSTVTLPFLTPKVSFERYAGLVLGFVPGHTEGKLNRNYRLRSDRLLPAGTITVRDEGRIVGQTGIGDTAKGEPLDLSLGQDPDLSFARDVKALRQDKTGATYRVTLTLENAKDRSLRAEVREQPGGNVTVEGQAERVPQGVLVRADVPARGKVTRVYTVSINY